MANVEEKEDFTEDFRAIEDEEDQNLTAEVLGLVLSNDEYSPVKASARSDVDSSSLQSPERLGMRESPPKDRLGSFKMFPGQQERFRQSAVKDVINEVMSDELQGKVYSSSDAEVWSKGIAKSVRDKVKELGFRKYKYVVQVVIGERRGAGSRVGARCLWDVSSDDYASAVFTNETIFCMTAVFGIYYY